jgi:hypothetical protein
MRNRIGHFKVAVSPRATRVNDTFWNSLMVKMGDLLAESEILQERRTPLPGFQRILIAGNDHALIGRERPLSRVSGLMRGAPRASDKVFLRIFELVSLLSCLFLPLMRSEQMTPLAATPSAGIRAAFRDCYCC